MMWPLLVVTLGVLAIPSMASDARAAGLPLVRDQVGARRNFAPWLTARDEHACAMLGSGAVRCWGEDSFNQLGDGSGTDQPVPVAVQNLGAVAVISAGHQHACALTAGGTVFCWGRNNVGQLGIGPNGDQPFPAIQTIEGAVAVAAGGQHSCAALSGGTVRCWGRNNLGQLGVSGTTTQLDPVDVGGVSGIVTVVAGNNYTCVLKSDGTVVCWGANAAGQVGKGNNDFTPRLGPTAVFGLSNAIALAAGVDHTCAVVIGGQVKCWGANGSGQLGNGSTSNSASPVNAGNTGVATAVAAGFIHSCALRVDGTVICWGDNSSGQLGDGTTQPHRTAQSRVLNLDNAIAVAAGSTMSCALRANGSARCWGANTHGQLGDGSSSPSTTPVTPVGVAGSISARAASAGQVHACAVRSDGTVACWGENDSGLLLGNGGADTDSGPTTVNGLGNVVAVSASNTVGIVLGIISHTCVLLANGSLKCWGANTAGQLGDGTNQDRPTPVTVSGLGTTPVVSVAVGTQHTCAALANGQVRCWGLGTSGQLGNGHTVNSAAPVQVTGLSDAIAVAAGGGSTCALRANGKIRCWGDNTAGQLGDGTNITPRSAPVDVVGVGDTVAVTQSGHQACAVTVGGGARCWGGNKTGALGNGTTDNSSTSVGVFSIDDAVAVSSGQDFGCAARVNGNVECWGSGGFGQLGDGSGGSSLFPVTVRVTPPGGGTPVTLPSAVTIGAGGLLACTVRANGVPNCWGAVGKGIVPEGTSNIAVPIPSFGFNVASTVDLVQQGKKVSATITALVDCPAGDELVITITLEQGSTQGTGETIETCAGQLAEFVVPVSTAGSAHFRPGPAKASAVAQVFQAGHALFEEAWSRNVSIEPPGR